MHALRVHILDMAQKVKCYGKSDDKAHDISVGLQTAAGIVHEWIEDMEDDGK